MTIFNIIRTKETTEVLPITLDDLVQEATAIGGLRIWQYERGRHFDVTIKFHRLTGSEIEAKASNTDLRLALRAAIDEARKLGAA